MKSLLSIGWNRKLAPNIPVFNLPHTICPIKSDFCKQYCYAKKAEYKPNVKKFRKYNYKVSKTKTFIERICNKLKTLKVNKIRIHESGDFYNQRYLNKWIVIAQKFPQITFLAFTKNYKLNFSKIPSNFKLYFSNDPSFVIPKRLYSFLQAHTVYSVNDRISNSKLCLPVNSEHKHYCGSKCNNCWEGKKNVSFIKH